MATDFYKEWLNIPEDQRPPNHYQLLGITPFTSDKEAIEKAARDRARLLKGYELGTHSQQSQQLLTEIARARADLSSPKRKAEYDSRLRAGEKAPQLEIDALEMFKNIVAFSIPRGNLSKMHMASLFAEAKRLKVPQEQAKAVIQPLYLQAKKQREQLAAARQAEAEKRELAERAVQRKAAAKKTAIVIAVLALVGVGAFAALRFRAGLEQKKKVQQVEKKKQQVEDESAQLLAEAERAERQENWKEAAELYEKVVSLSDDAGAKSKLGAMRDILDAIRRESEEKWSEAAGLYKKAGRKLKNPRLFEDKLTFLQLAGRYDEVYGHAKAQQDAGKTKEAVAAFRKALDIAKQAKLETDAEARIEALNALLAKRAAAAERAKRLLGVCSKRKDLDALSAAAGFYVAHGETDEVRRLGAEAKAAAAKGLKPGKVQDGRKAEEILSSCAASIRKGKCYAALKEIGLLQYRFGRERVCTDKAYQAEIAGKAAEGGPKTIEEMLRRCVDYGESMCPNCLGSGRLECPLCKDMGRIEKTCDVCNGRGSLRGCEACMGTGFVLGPCMECRGTGRWKCDKCRGKGCKFCGHKPKRDCTYCKGTGRAPTKKRCSACGGKGKLGGKTCPKCKGKGKPLCKECGGSGRKPCEKCKGTGKISVPCPRCSKGVVRRCPVCAGTGKHGGK